MKWCADCYTDIMQIMGQDRATGLDFTHQLVNQANYLENTKARLQCAARCLPNAAALATLEAINKSLFVLDQGGQNGGA